jgi:hypothetical protein
MKMPPYSQPLQQETGIQPGASTRPPPKSSAGRTALKWVLGVLLAIVLIATLAAFVASRTTDRSNAEATIHAMHAPLLSLPFIEDELRAYDPAFYEFLSSPEFASQVYDNPDLIQDYVDQIPQTDPELVEQADNIFDGYSSMVTVLGSEGHDETGPPLTILVIAVIVLAVPFVLLCRGAGRLVGPGIVLAIASWPFLALALITRSYMNRAIAEAMAEVDTQFKELLTETLEQFAAGLLDVAVSIYGIFSLLALVLLIAGVTTKSVLNR